MRRAAEGASRRKARLLAIVLCGVAGCASAPGPEYGRALAPSEGNTGPPQVSSTPTGAGLGAAQPWGRSEAAQAELTDVPFFPQEDHQCGPAALATALQATGIARTPAQLMEQVYLPERQGSLQVELLGASRRAGAVPYVLRSEPDDLLREVAAGHPVVVLQDVGLPLLPQWHYAVVVGYDLAARTLTLRSGTIRRLVMPLADFDRTWARSGRWAFVALPPDRLPATASEAGYVAAAAAFERVMPTLGPRAYETALRAWPTSLFARLALGNAAYRRHDLDAARAQYEQATRDHPESGDAWNNLAQVLSDSGRFAEALRAARRAVAIGGPRATTYAATLRGIEPAGVTPSP